MYLIKNAEVYAPERLGKQDILVISGRIVQVARDIDVRLEGLEVVDAAGRIAVPGFLDPHVHLIGGGGEGGFHTRTPEFQITDAIRGGVTTLVGVLGTDGFTKTVESLLAKTKEINTLGLTAYCLTGSYHCPSPTVTGDVAKDIVCIQEIIGCKLAISDHRASFPTDEELRRLAADIRMAALVSGKPGVLHIHVGALPTAIEPIFRLVEDSHIPVKHFRPTHMGRHREAAVRFTKLGGYADITAKPGSFGFFPELVRQADSHYLTISSDGNGSMPRWNADRSAITGITMGRVTSLNEVMRELVCGGAMTLEAFLPFVTRNTAESLDLFPRKGAIAPGADADLLLLDQSLHVASTMARGRWMLREGEMRFEPVYQG